MIGYRAPGNDVYVFFENDEFRAEGNSFQGTFFSGERKGKLEFSVEDLKNERVHWRVESKPELKLKIKVRRQEYERFRERGQLELHEMPGHVFLLDAKNLEFRHRFNYQQLVLARQVLCVTK